MQNRDHSCPTQLRSRWCSTLPKICHSVAVQSRLKPFSAFFQYTIYPYNSPVHWHFTASTTIFQPETFLSKTSQPCHYSLSFMPSKASAAFSCPLLNFFYIVVQIPKSPSLSSPILLTLPQFQSLTALKLQVFRPLLPWDNDWEASHGYSVQGGK